MTDYKITQYPIERVIPYARNARKISEKAVAKVAASLREYGWRQPIVVDADGVIIAGHTRLLAAQRLGMTTVPVHVADGLTPQQVKAYRLADNRTHQEAEWDMDLLKLELPEVDGLFTGFDEGEIDFGEVDFAPGTEDGQGTLSELQPKLVQCPACGHVHDARSSEYGG